MLDSLNVDEYGANFIQQYLTNNASKLKFEVSFRTNLCTGSRFVWWLLQNVVIASPPLPVWIETETKKKINLYIFKNRKNSSDDDFIHFGEPEETGLVVLTQLGVPGDCIRDDVDVPGDCIPEDVELGLVDFLIIKGGGLGLVWKWIYSKIRDEHRYDGNPVYLYKV